MRARPAYISSLGTTAILVAAALLMLGVVGAIVAFRGWPGSATGSGGVQSVPLAPSGRATQAALVRRVPAARGVERSKSRATRRPAAAARRAKLSTAGLVKGEASGPRVVPGIVMEPTTAAPMQAQPSSPGRAQTVAQASPTPSTAPERPVAPPSDGPLAGSGDGITIPLPIPAPPAPAGPLPDPTASLPDPTAPLPDPTGALPSPDQVTSMVGALLAGGTQPPPPLLDQLGLR